MAWFAGCRKHVQHLVLPRRRRLDKAGQMRVLVLREVLWWLGLFLSRHDEVMPWSPRLAREMVQVVEGPLRREMSVLA
jgi:hypothetical protein